MSSHSLVRGAFLEAPMHFCRVRRTGAFPDLVRALESTEPELGVTVEKPVA